MGASISPPTSAEHPRSQLPSRLDTADATRRIGGHVHFTDTYLAGSNGNSYSGERSITLIERK